MLKDERRETLGSDHKGVVLLIYVKRVPLKCELHDLMHVRSSGQQKKGGKSRIQMIILEATKNNPGES